MISTLRKRGPASAVPDVVVKFTEQYGAASKYAPNARLARAVPPAKGGVGDTWFIVPGADSVCFHVGEAGACSPAERVRQGKLALFAYPPPPPVPVVDGHVVAPSSAEVAAQSRVAARTGEVKVFGVAPDGYTSVTADSASGPVEAPVVDNVYAIRGEGLTDVALRGTDAPALAVQG